MTACDKIALVTGATGFVGSCLTRRLVSDGWQVHAIIRPESSLVQLRDVVDRVTLHSFDGSTENMLEIVGRSNPVTVFHLASLFISEHQPKDIESLVRSNLLFGTQLVEAMAANGVENLVNTGTSWQHYQNEEGNPVNLYAATKQAFEAILRYYVETKFLRVITLKLFDTYGPTDPRPKLFSLLARLAKTGESLDMSPGEQFIDLVFIDDVVEAFLHAAELQAKSRIGTSESYAITSGAPLKLKEMVKSFEKVTSTPLSIQWGGRPYRNREVMKPWDSGTPLPGWRPKVSLIEGLELLFSQKRNV